MPNFFIDNAAVGVGNGHIVADDIARQIGQEEINRALEEFARHGRENPPPPIRAFRGIPPAPLPLGANPEFLAAPAKKGFPFFRTLLENVKEIYDVDGFVSGGCIRDTLLEVPYKDVDLFLPIDLKTFEESCEELGWQCRGRLGGKNYLKGAPTGRYSASSNGQMIDVVLLGADREDPVASFPAHWTRARYTLKNGGQLDTTQEFDSDMSAKTCTVQADLEPDHLDNLHKRFDQWVERTGLTGWSFKIEGLDKNDLQAYITKKALAMKKVVGKKKKSSIHELLNRQWGE